MMLLEIFILDSFPVVNFSSSHNLNKRENKPLILAVEDGADNLELMIQLIEIVGFPLITAIDGQTGIDMAQEYRPDLILLDIMLPDIDGIEVASCLKQDSRTMKIPIIAVTALSAEEDRERCRSAGCIDIVPKPIDLELLETTINRYLQQSNL